MTVRKRSWYSGPTIIVKTVGQSLATLRAHRLGVLLPVALVLFLGSALLWVVNSIAPLAPFVYSLF